MLSPLSLRESAPAGLRRKLASIRALRSSWHFTRALLNELRWRPISQNRYAEAFRARTDPWDYEVTPFTLEKFQAAIELLDDARNSARFERAWEIGCAEGISAIKAIRRSPSSCLHGRNGCRECIGAQHAPRPPGVLDHMSV